MHSILVGLKRRTLNNKNISNKKSEQCLFRFEPNITVRAGHKKDIKNKKVQNELSQYLNLIKSFDHFK